MPLKEDVLKTFQLGKPQEQTCVVLKLISTSFCGICIFIKSEKLSKTYFIPMTSACPFKVNSNFAKKKLISR